jgi:hypothetical protein
MDDEQITDLLVAASLATPCAHARARCHVEAQPHRWYLDLVHTQRSATPEHRIVSWQTLVETKREAQVADLSVWLRHLHAATDHPSPSQKLDGGSGGGGAPIDADALSDAASRDGIAGRDGLSDSAWDRVASSRAD